MIDTPAATRGKSNDGENGCFMGTPTNGCTVDCKGRSIVTSQRAGKQTGVGLVLSHAVARLLKNVCVSPGSCEIWQDFMSFA